jgi:hypothetical protein
MSNDEIKKKQQKKKLGLTLVNLSNPLIGYWDKDKSIKSKLR